MSDAQPLTSDWSILPRSEIRAAIVGILAAGMAWGVIHFFPAIEVEFFARGAATLAALFSGAPVGRVDMGWLLADGGQPVVVSAACSATGYFLTVVALLGWRLERLMISPPLAMGAAVIVALPVTLFVNALRVIAVMYAHQWVIPRFPETYGPFLHMLAGVGVFLPALIVLNLVLEYHGNRRRHVR